MDVAEFNSRAYSAGIDADRLIKEEIERQDKMWGVANERADASDGQLMMAGIAQLDALFDRRNGIENAFEGAPEIYPVGWSGFRDYGSDVANLVVSIAFLRQEVKRLIAEGESTYRAPRNPESQPYTADQPKTITA
jgi:hypothetical protein